ncbi:F-box/kelch-repeat protein At5g43190-like [Phoenix dactylifera]|uniref:F-box/kelch-repeat protein At5g43190-like n=1 Tax=Phoenix dactylifera TaxID=42345 RepID=A0A8B8ZR93_PHODC|nr:F-box/kelch-repeat protein At5g43190-like [Phoenix dactylifera]
MRGRGRARERRTEDRVPRRERKEQTMPIARAKTPPPPPAPPAAAAGREEEMEPAIWGRLPDELLDLILALLPLHTLVALRPTCKRFHSLLLSPSFLSLLHSPSSSPAFLLLSHPQFSNRFLHLYDSFADGWRPLRLLPSAAASPSQLLSSSYGLLCFSLLPSRPSSLLISNLLTKTSKFVPLPTSDPLSDATLVSLPSSTPHGYKIFLPSSSSNSVFVYDSASFAWTRFPGFDLILDRGNSHQEGVFFDGALYFTTHEPFSVVGFDLQSGKWEPMASPSLPTELAFVRLVGDGGNRLYLVGGVGRDGISRSLRVWELVGKDGKGKARAWEEVGRLPEMMCRKFVSVCYHNYSHVYCLWHEGLVCVCCTTWPEVLFYKVARGTWHWLPRCPMLPEKWSCGFRWYSFVPDLYALV